MSDSKAPDSDADMTASYSSRIGLIADIHWTPDDADEIQKRLTTAIEHFEHSNVDRIVMLGDLIEESDDGFEATHDRLTEALSLFEDTDIPVTHLLGNHDVMHGIGPGHFQGITGDYPTHGTFQITDDITGIYLDTSASEYPDARGKLSETSLDELDAHLDAAEYAVVFSHHPLYYHDLDDDGHFPEHPEAAFASNKYLANEIFADHGNVLAAVNGHTHLSDHTIYQDVPYFTINAFNHERPGYTDVNGSFAVLDVSRSEIQRLSHRHGTYEDTDTVPYPAGDQKVAIGGTFGPLHDGHRQMFQRAFEVGDVLVGLTSDDLSQETRHTERPVPSFEERKTTLEMELQHYADTYDRSFEVNELTDPMGYVTEDPSFTHLIVSPETFARGETVNEARLENGLEPLTLEVVDPVLAEDGQRISSTRIVNGEIDEHGNLME